MIFEKIKEIIGSELDIDIDSVMLTSNLAEDFDADSLDIVDIVMGIEDEFGIEIPDDRADVFKTVADVVKFVEENVK